ncbi:MAG: MurR/RpiR family transcriptional regulator [Lactimicrobium massiliense]|nr:MurR/RpiR family transcriptional regulator [Lactimicrobium massiliense]MDD6559548.1 MurR/RpiR family transcriptional regulator [Lactimicrobium massiliense]
MSDENKIGVNLTPSENYVYRFVLEHRNEIADMPIEVLAKMTNTSAATVSRMCRKLGYSGYYSLRYNLVNDDFPSMEEKSVFSDNLRELRYFFNTFVYSKEFLENLDQAANIIANHEMIFFVGKGASNILGEYGSCYFSSYFHLSFRIEDIASYPIDYLSPSLAKKSCIIACSVSGMYQDISAYVRNYHTSGISLITITSNRKSVLAEISDACIYYPMGQVMEGDQNLTTQVPCCYIIEQLARRARQILSYREQVREERKG